MRKTSLMIAVVLLFTGCTINGPGNNQDKNTYGTRYRYEVVAERLRSPWAIDRSGGTFFISEREGQIVKVEDGKTERQPVKLARPVSQKGEGGLLGFVLSPDYRSTKQAFVYHTYLEGNNRYNRIVKIQNTGSEWLEVEALLESIPGATIHNGGRLKIGPDGYLYATTGDASEEKLAQDRNSLAGKILRLRLDGTIPDDNPFDGSYVFSLGHRNPQGLGWNAAGEMFSTEHGPSSVPGGHDEINRIEPGNNYGWPTIIGDESEPGMTRPVYHTGSSTLAPSGLAVDSKGELLVAGLRGEQLLGFAPDLSGFEVELDGEGRLRDVLVEGEYVYIVTNNTDGRGKPGPNDDRLLRIAD